MSLQQSCWEVNSETKAAMRERRGPLPKRDSRRGRIYCSVDVASERARVWETFECHGDFVCMSLLTIFRPCPNKMMVNNKLS